MCFRRPRQLIVIGHLGSRISTGPRHTNHVSDLVHHPTSDLPVGQSSPQSRIVDGRFAISYYYNLVDCYIHLFSTHQQPTQESPSGTEAQCVSESRCSTSHTISRLSAGRALKLILSNQIRQLRGFLESNSCVHDVLGIGDLCGLFYQNLLLQTLQKCGARGA
jgi:hypothetical protein